MKLLDANGLYSICLTLSNVRNFGRTYYSGQSGMDAVYVKIDEKTGLKAYNEQSIAKICYHYTRIFSHFGLTPKAWGLSTVEIYGVTIWYFFTEHCEEYEPEYIYENAECFCEDDDNCFCDEEQVVDETDMQEINTHMRMISGFENPDTHAGNYGYLNGNLVCIDVGNIMYKEYNGTQLKIVSPKFS